MVKPDAETSLIAPAAPPCAGADRAFEPRAPDEVAVLGAEAFGAEELGTTSPTDSPIKRTNAKAATIHVLLFFESHRRTFSFEVIDPESFIVLLLTHSVTNSVSVTLMNWLRSEEHT